MAQQVTNGAARGTTVHSALQTAATLHTPVRFVAQNELPDGMAYEQFIFTTRSVPTRDNLHDFFNGLVWTRFPHTKQRLNQLQAQVIAAEGVQAVRGPLRDALTVFDENGAVLSAPPAVGRDCSEACARCGTRRTWSCSAMRCSKSWFHPENRW